MNDAHKAILEFKRKLLADNLARCTQEQRDFFKRLYPNGPKEDQLEWATQQCMNTLKKNAAKQEEGKP